ncbi:MAG TPA: hypothetical protein VHJ20_16050 [Polyangia bacterium]|nr:hypothetical protein [Polyangia bacterium]
MLLGLSSLVAGSACRKHAAELPAGPQTPPPDLPRAFGPRSVWFAFHGPSSTDVAAALGLKEVAPSSWEAGVAGAYAGRVFVTPPIDGWVLATSARFPDAGGGGHEDSATPMLEQLSKRFGEVQYFGSYDEIGWSAWARFRDGTPVRKFSFLGAQDVVLWNEGAPTPEEHELGLAFGKQRAATDGGGLDATSVFAVARKWSVDPAAIQSRHLGPSLGVSGTM